MKNSNETVTYQVRFLGVTEQIYLKKENQKTDDHQFILIIKVKF